MPGKAIIGNIILKNKNSTIDQMHAIVYISLYFSIILDDDPRYLNHVTYGTTSSPKLTLLNDICLIIFLRVKDYVF